jgi:hypothetical protein
VKEYGTKKPAKPRTVNFPKQAKSNQQNRMQTTLFHNNTNNNNVVNNAAPHQLHDFLCVILTVAMVLWSWHFRHDIVRTDYNFVSLTLGLVMVTASYLLGQQTNPNNNAVAADRTTATTPITTGVSGNSSIGNLLFLIALVLVVLNYMVFAILAFTISWYPHDGENSIGNSMGAGMFALLLALVWMIMAGYAYRLLWLKKQSTSTTSSEPTMIIMTTATAATTTTTSHDPGAAAAMVEATPIATTETPPPADEEEEGGALSPTTNH